MLQRHVLRAVIVSTFVFMVVAFIQISGGKSRNGHGARGFPQPQVRQSSDGVLQTTPSCHCAQPRAGFDDWGNTRDRDSTYEGTILGPRCA